MVSKPMGRRERTVIGLLIAATSLGSLPFEGLQAQTCDPYYEPSCADDPYADPYSDPSGYGGDPGGEVDPSGGEATDVTMQGEPDPATDPFPTSLPEGAAAPSSGPAGVPSPVIVRLLNRSQPLIQPVGGPAPETLRELLAGRLVLATDALSELGAFARHQEPAVNARVREIADVVPAAGLDAAGYRRELSALEIDLPVLLQQLRAGGAEPSPNLLAVDAALDPTMLSALDAGNTAVTDPRVWLEAIADVLQRGGEAGGPETSAVDTGAVRSFVALFAWPVPRSNGGSAPTSQGEVTSLIAASASDSSSAGNLVRLAIPGGVLAVIGVALAFRLGRHRATRPAAAAVSAPAASTGAPQPSPGSLTELLEVSRRMTATFDPNAVASIACSESSRMVAAEGAILVRRQDGVVTVAHHEPAHLFELDGLPRSLLNRVIETGRSVASVATEEPILVDVPVALAAVAIVADGSVVGALLVVRRPNRPFAPSDLEALETLAPLVGSSLVAAQAHGSATELADIDALTGLANRRRLDRDLAALVDADVAAYVMIDVDHFKHFNDTNGHAAGDLALSMVAHAIRDHVRPGDRVYRYGGEEFCFLLPATTQAAAELVADRVRRAVEALAVPGGENQPGGRVTISVGVADTAPGPEGLVERADAALYIAKESGRNQVRRSGATA